MFVAGLIPHIDLTRLNDADTIENITALCQQAATPQGEVAAVCVHPQFVAHAKAMLRNTKINIATVVNFPEGLDSLADAVAEIQRALSAGANEIDVVMPYVRYLKGEKQAVFDFIQACRQACDQDAKLKVILETGALAYSDLVFESANLAINAGADFIKTSTGKTTQGATLEAAESILKAIKLFPNKEVGLKVSGGLRTVEQAQAYVKSIEKIMGQAWISPRTLRFGASSLLDAILTRLAASSSV